MARFRVALVLTFLALGLSADSLTASARQQSEPTSDTPASTQPPDPAATPSLAPTAEDAQRAAPPAANGTPESEPKPEPGVSPDPAELELPEFGTPAWMVVPAIELDAAVRSVGAKNGVYDVPWFDVGWQNDSAPLGAPGNTVFNGHLDTIDAGRVFYRLKDLQPGDAVYLYTDAYRTDWVVEWAGTVPNTDWWFVEPTDDVRLTLYTCEGAWNWLTQQYAEYRVVVARFYDAVERAAPDQAVS